MTGDLIAGNVFVEEEDRKNWYHCDGVNFSPKAPKTNIAVDPGIVTSDSTPVKISYKSDEQPISWKRIHRTGHGMYSEKGTVKTTFSWTSRGMWEGGTEEHPNMLQLRFTNDKNWQIETQTEDPDWWEKWFQGKSGDVPVRWKDITVPGPNVQLTLKALDYFMVTNLLFPGQHIFQAHSPVADSSKSTGLAAPRDIILTGDISTFSNAPMISS